MYGGRAGLVYEVGISVLLLFSGGGVASGVNFGSLWAQALDRSGG